MAKLLYLVPLVFVAFFVFSKSNQINSSETKTIQIGNKTYKLEIAQTNQERQIGLSNRDSLCPTCGMLFIFEKPGIYPFWMKDTRLPLDIIWLDENGKILNYHTANPEPDSKLWELKLYQNTTPAKYVIELNSGDFVKNNLKVGDMLNIKL